MLAYFEQWGENWQMVSQKISFNFSFVQSFTIIYSLQEWPLKNFLFSFNLESE